MSHSGVQYFYGTRGAGKKEQALRVALPYADQPGLHVVIMCATDAQARRATTAATACGYAHADVQCTASSSVRHVQAQMYRCRALCTTPPKWHSLVHSGTVCADRLSCVILMHIEDLVALHRRHISAVVRLMRAPALQMCCITSSSLAAPAHIAALRREPAPLRVARDVPELTVAAARASHACLPVNYDGAVVHGLRHGQTANDGKPLIIARGYRAAVQARDDLAANGCDAQLLLSDAADELPPHAQQCMLYSVSTFACARTLPHKQWTSVWLLSEQPTTDCWLSAACLAPERPVYSSALDASVRDELAACGIQIEVRPTSCPA